MVDVFHEVKHELSVTAGIMELSSTCRLSSSTLGLWTGLQACKHICVNKDTVCYKLKLLFGGPKIIEDGPYFMSETKEVNKYGTKRYNFQFLVRLQDVRLGTYATWF